MEAYAPDGQQNAQAEQRGPDGVPVDAVRTAEHGQEIFQCGFGVWQRSFLRVAAVHQVGERQAQCIRQWFQRVDIRQTDAPLPAADGFVGHMQLCGQVGLRQPAGLAGPGQKGPEIFGVHTVHILWGQDSIPGSKTQPTLRLPALERKNPRRVLGQ